MCERTPSRLASLVLGVLLVCAVVSVAAQTGQTTGEVTGTVLDDQRGLLPGVSVTLSGPRLMAEQATVTSERGTYSIPLVPSGTYTLKFELAGFQTVIRREIVVATRTTVTLDVTMSVSALEETITVSGASPIVDVVNTTTGQRLGEELLANVPTTRSLMGVVASLPGVVLGRPDIGGLQQWNVPSLFSHGQADYQISYNGTRAQDPGPNCSFYYIDFDGSEEVSAQTSGMNAEVGPAGAAINIIPKAGANNYSGSLYFTGTTKDFAGNNVDERLRSLGVSLGTIPVRFGDVHFDSSGRIVKDRVWWYGSYRNMRTLQTVIGFPDDYPAETRNVTIHPTIQAAANHRLSFMWMGHTKIEAYRDASQTVPKTATHDYHGPMHFANANWNAVLSPKAYFEVATGIYANLIRRNDAPSWLALPVRTPPILDLATNIRAGQHSTGSQIQSGYTNNTSMAVTLVKEGWLGASHQFKAGFSIDNQWQDNLQLPYDDSQWEYTNGVPTQLTAYSSPATAKIAMRPHAGFIQDRISYQRVTFNLGLRLADFSRAWYPEQQGGPGLWVAQTNYPKVSVPLKEWKYNPAPRLGVAYKLTADGRNVAKASFGRYYDNLAGTMFSILNPNTFAAIGTYRWFGDANGNGRLDANEYDPQPLTVNRAASNAISPNFKQPKVDEMTLAFERQVANGLALSVTFVRRAFTDNWADVNVGIPLTAYSPVSVADSGPDNIRGTGDDSTLTMYTMDRAYLGRQAYSRETVPGEKTYTSLELTAIKRLGNGLQITGGYVYARDYGLILTNQKMAPDPNDPNATLEVNQTGWDGQSQPHAFKMLANLRIPLDLNLGINYQFFSGAPYDRTVRAALNQGAVIIRAEERGAYRADAQNLLSVKLDKAVEVGRMKLSGFIEGHNLLNSNAGVTYGTLTQNYASPAALAAANLTSTAYFGRPSVILQPRLFKLGGRLGW